MGGRGTDSDFSSVSEQTTKRSAKRVRRAAIPAVRDWSVALSGGLTLAFTAWGIGGVEIWSLHVLLVGGLLTLLLALGPTLEWRASSGSANPGRPRPQFVLFNGAGFGRLLRLPYFWLSLAFWLYLLVGALNPGAACLREPGRGWWVEAIPAPLGTTLPTSVRSGYDPMNAWRVLVSFSAAFALSWGLWAGLTRRKPLLLVLWSFLISGSCMALVAILQQLNDADLVLWTFPSSNANFWGSFFYRNQGAAYLNLVLVGAAVLFFYHAVKSRQHLRSGGPHFLCFFLYAATATSVGLALSRGGILFGLLLTLAFIVLLAIFAVQGLFHVRSLVLTALTLVLLGVGAYSIIHYIDLDAIEERFGDVEATLENAGEDARALSTRATWDMAQGRLAQGWGAGSFRYIFPMYQRNYPELFYGRYDRRNERWVGRKLYHYAHNDIVQFIAEYGVIGTTLIFGALATLLGQALLHSGRHNFAVLMLLAGTAQAFGHAFLDFIFNSPAYWMAFLALLVGTVRLLALEASAKRRGR
jgi:O-antigen ligase